MPTALPDPHLPMLPLFPSGAKVVAIFDLDGTLTRRDTYLWFLSRQLVRRPWRCWQLLPLVIMTMGFRIGWINNRALKEAFLSRLLGGEARATLERWSENFSIHVVSKGLRPRALAQIEAHRRAGHRLLLATASLDVYTAPIARALGFDGLIATCCEWTPQGRLTGKLAGDNLRGEAKLVHVRNYLGADWDACYKMAYSDHHSDIFLLQAVHHGVAVNPTRQLRTLAESRGLPVEDWDR